MQSKKLRSVQAFQQEEPGDFFFFLLETQEEGL